MYAVAHNVIVAVASSYTFASESGGMTDAYSIMTHPAGQEMESSGLMMKPPEQLGTGMPHALRATSERERKLIKNRMGLKPYLSILWADQ